MKKLISGLMAALALMAAAVEVELCERWDDIGTNLSLPNEIAGMRMQKRNLYGKDDHSFFYASREFVAGTAGQRMLTVYLYKRDGAKLDAEGVCEDVRKELVDVVKAVQQRPDGAYKNIMMRKNEERGKIGATDYLAAEFTYRDARTTIDWISSLTTSW